MVDNFPDIILYSTVSVFLFVILGTVLQAEA